MARCKLIERETKEMLKHNVGEVIDSFTVYQFNPNDPYGSPLVSYTFSNLKIVGIVENMSYFKCPNCNEKHHIFGNSHVTDVAKKYGITEIAELAMDPEVADACDRGDIESVERPELDSMVNACLEAENPNKHDGMPEPPEGCTHDCSTCNADCNSRQ